MKTRKAADQFSRRDMLWIGTACATFGILMASAPETAAASVAASQRPDRWARAVELAGVPNLHRVTPRFYRSAQPTREGFASLSRQLGVRSVVSLRRFHADDVLAGGQNLLLTRIPMNTWHIEREDVVAALRAVRKAQALGPVLLHCQHGADRTGLISALHRVIFESWSKADALAEMRQGDFGYHAVWGNIPTCLKKVDIVALKSAVGTV